MRASNCFANAPIPSPPFLPSFRPQHNEIRYLTTIHTEEHHITSFDSGTFFTLHDYDSTGKWSAEDVRKTYGLLDESAATIPQAKKDDVVRIVFQMYDKDGDGFITKDEYLEGINSGLKLPDFGTGPGHHGDDEYEYEYVSPYLGRGLILHLGRRPGRSSSANAFRGVAGIEAYMQAQPRSIRVHVEADANVSCRIHHFEKYHGGDDVKEEDLIHPEDVRASRVPTAAYLTDHILDRAFRKARPFGRGAGKARGAGETKHS